MPPRRDRLIGKKVGEYEVVSRIGEGGMGEVYDGRHPLIGKRVAIKTLLPQYSSDEALTQRFIAEARAVNAIRHRGIVDIFGFGKLEDGTQYCIMEFLDGMGFDVLIQRNAPMAAPEVVEWLDQIVDALGAAHAAGVIHRDIKPSNVFLVDTGHGHPYVKLLDFGIAKVDAVKGGMTPQTRASMIMGTPDYMAPEQVRGDPVSAATDLYALGCMLHHMLTGTPPYGGPNAMGSMFAHLEQPVMRPGAKRPDLLPALDDLAVWMMQKEPAHRPQSAADVEREIDAMWPDLFGGPHPPRRGAPRRTVAAPRPRASPPQPPSRATRPPLDVETRAHVAVDPLLETAPNPEPLAIDTTVRAGVDPALETALKAAPEATTDPVQPQPDVDPAQLGLRSPRRWPIFAGLALFAAAATAGVLWFRSSLPVETNTIVVAPVVEKPAPAPEPVVAEPEPEPVAPSPAEPKVAKVTPVTAPMLSARLKKLDGMLRDREAAAGGELGVMRQLLEETRRAAAAAKDDAARKRVWNQMSELQAQLR